MGAEDRAECGHVAASCSIAAWLGVAQLTHMLIANAGFLQRFRQDTLREAWPAGLGQLTHIEQQGYAGPLQRRDEIRNGSTFITQRVDPVQLCLLSEITGNVLGAD
ncbi:hypothetical protein A0J57_10625 [Sphingobium sp. 22B]|jgi:hypothetical protein|nr:hypothetical protein AXW74_19410 [Sphingobium sp. AM]KYC32375.1 hypothetical protein A0J57_10625 [Sphingobium sp. 22B]OAP32004.1 hypothetical protein A8O16_10415 [Sphingobium sp. 20006FA]